VLRQSPFLRSTLSDIISSVEFELSRVSHSEGEAPILRENARERAVELAKPTDGATIFKGFPFFRRVCANPMRQSVR
jgi:hypothetical protein